MAAPLSIIIPTLNASGQIEGCLAALAEGVPAGLIREVIVVDGGSTDRTLLPAFEAGANIVCGVRGRGRQLAAGAAKAKGDWLLCVHADTWLSDGWADAVRAHIEASPEKAAAFELGYRSEAKGARWLERRANWRTKTFGLPYGDQGLLISRTLYNDIGGFQDVPLMEDVQIARQIGKSRLARLPVKAMTSAEKYERDGWRKRGWANSVLTIRYYLGASPEKLARKYT